MAEKLAADLAADWRYLSAVGRGPDDAIEPARTALRLAHLDRPSVALADYDAHIAALGEAVRSARPPPDAAVLAAVLAERYGYRGDAEHYDDPDNANLISVIDRRRGLPVALGLLYLQSARDAGLDAAGLSFPGHFLVRVGAEVIDPFAAGRVIAEPDMEHLLQRILGPDARLGPEHRRDVGARQVLLRLLNNIVNRAAGDVARAADIVERMTALEPDNAGLWYRLGAARADSDAVVGAIAALETAARLAGPAERPAIEAALRQTRQRLN